MNSDITSVIDALRPYATAAPSDEPPELLPWDANDKWALNGAAGQAIAMLVQGVTPSAAAFAMADYLLTYNSPGYAAGPRPPDSDGLLLNGTALALLGYLMHGEHPEAEMWRLTGCARLASVVHFRRAALEDQMSCLCVMAVCRVAATLEMPILADLLTLQERMWGRLVDHGRAERLQVTADQFPSHMIDPVAPDQVGGALRARAWQSDVATPGSMVQMDLEDADGLCSNLVTLRAHMLVRHQFGGEIDWHLRRLRRRRVDGQPQCAHPDPQPRVGVRADQ